MTCTWFEMLSCIPFAGLRLRLCRRHLDRCQDCRQASDRTESLPSLLVSADRLPSGLDLWPGIREKINGAPVPEHDREAAPPLRRLPRRLAYAAAMLMLLLAGFWIIVSGRRGSMLPSRPSAYRPAPQTRLCSAKIEDRPARVFQVQSRNPNRTIFWIAKDNHRS
jgi:hypothetical protein